MAGVSAAGVANTPGAVLWFRRVLAVEPAAEDGVVNLANALVSSGRWPDATRHLRRMLAVVPARALAHYNAGVAAMHLGRYDDVVLRSRRARVLDPSLADATYNEAQARLALGDWRRGFALYEERWNAPSFPVRWRPFPGRRWDGRAAPGAHLLLLAEQGYGDTIQFVRYAALCVAQVGRATLVCPSPLLALMAMVPGIDVIAEGAALPDADRHAPLASLPYLFGSTPTTVPTKVPYLPLDPARRAEMAARLPATRHPRVGVCWKGNPAFVDDARRSPGLEVMRPIFATPDVSFVSLVKSLGSDRLDGLPIADPMDAMRDFADTAHLLAGLDLVITSDTSVAHLAGALGRPVWLLLSAAADWRWLLDRTDTPWYPTVTLVRQSTLGDWSEVVIRIQRMLRAWAARAPIPTIGGA